MNTCHDTPMHPRPRQSSISARQLAGVLGWFILSLGLTAACGAYSEQASNQIAVIYPKVREPYRSIFLSIIEGIEAQVSSTVPTYELPEGNEAQDQVINWLHNNQFNATIVLGKRGLDLFQALNQGQRLVFGGVYANPQEISDSVRTISMAPSPQQLFARLLELAPQTERINVVHDPGPNDWLLELAAIAAQSNQLELNVVKVETIREAADAYRDLLRHSTSGKDALWLLQGARFLQERSLLDMILKEAWRRNLVVFSSNPSHVPKGALFALYPDNRELGQELALAALAAEPLRGVTPIERLDTAVNVRTAEHLGIDIDKSLPDKVDMAFPNR